jgi:type IV pilus assembly protein PilE
MSMLKLANHHQEGPPQSQQGFSLTELLIVLGIVAIISAFGVPAYTSQINKAHRADAQAALMQLASAMERFRTVNNSYCTGAACPQEDATPASNFFPATVPLNSNEALYNLRITSDANTYTITAVPIDRARMDGDWTFTLQHTGRKGRSRGDLSESNWDI